MEGQINLFDYIEEKHKRVKPCECGNDRLAVRYTGCGIPIQYDPPIYEKYLFCVFCPQCFNVAMSGNYDGAWRSNKTSIQEAVKDWNTFNHRNEADKQYGSYGHKHYAEIMEQTKEQFESVKEALYG